MDHVANRQGKAAKRPQSPRTLSRICPSLQIKRVNREAIRVKPFVVEHRLRHRDLFEYEYEYRCTEYDLSDVHDGESPIRFVTTAETLSEALPPAPPGVAG